MGVLDDVDRRGFPGQRGGIDKSGQPPPTSIRVDSRQNSIRIADAQQVIKQQQVLWVRVTNPVAQSIPGGLRAETLNPRSRAQ